MALEPSPSMDGKDVGNVDASGLSSASPHLRNQDIRKRWEEQKALIVVRYHLIRHVILALISSTFGRSVEGPAKLPSLQFQALRQK